VVLEAFAHLQIETEDGESRTQVVTLGTDAEPERHTDMQGPTAFTPSPRSTTWNTAVSLVPTLPRDPTLTPVLHAYQTFVSATFLPFLQKHGMGAFLDDDNKVNIDWIVNELVGKRGAACEKV
jgi:hypothetical protein